MEAIITIVGFLGAGKTTLLKSLIGQYKDAGWDPFVVLNDYENADLDAQQLSSEFNPNWITGLSGSCICCTGIAQLRDSVNSIPPRDKGITLIEANGTSDACALMGFLGIGMDERYSPPIQVSVVDVKNWQKRGEHNELEANQVQVSSLIVLNHLQGTDDDRQKTVIASIREQNSSAEIITSEQLEIGKLPHLQASLDKAKTLDHSKAHWSSCSVELPELPNKASLERICHALPNNILRIKGFCKIGDESGFTYFERTPDGKVYTRPYNGVPIMNAKILVVGPGSDPEILERIIYENT
jgi:G3E family GTPase